MADRKTLHKSKINEFKEWMLKDGWAEDLNLTNPFECFRFQKQGKRKFILYTRLRNAEHFSIKDCDFYLVRDFLREKGKQQKLPW